MSLRPLSQLILSIARRRSFRCKVRDTILEELWRVDRIFVQKLQPGGLQVTASFGVSALALISSEANFNALFKLADHALYQAKHEGRNRVVIASASED